jgi:PKD repeat protein
MVQLDDGTVPSSNFSASRTRGVAPLCVSFTDESQGEVTAWLWSFGDGQQSSQPSPSKTYDRPGSYDVQLTTRGPGGTDVETKRGFIAVTEGVLADFDATPRGGPCPLVVSFDDRSEGQITSWSWDLGDGTTSSGPSPSHVYAVCGSYAVSLTVSGPWGTDTDTRPDFVVVALLPPDASFTATPTAGEAALTVQFFDTTQGQVTGWSWDFGDGYTSSLRNPQHTYEVEGLYSVSLTAQGPGGNDTHFEFDLVDVGLAATAADFDATPLSGPCPLAVSFDDRSEGQITSWSWDLGDGATSSEQDPVHVYATPGVYGVTLIATGPGGSRALTRTDLITVEVAPPDAAPTPRVMSIAATSALIAWRTDELSTSVVRYGATTAYGSIASAGELTTRHAVELEGLSPSTLYHFRVESTDETGNTVQSADGTLRTGELSSYEPSATTVLQGKRKAGDFTKLGKDDNKYYEVESTRAGTRTTDWYGSTTVPVPLAGSAMLTVAYSGKNSKAVSQSVHLWSWSASAWILLDTRSVNPEQPVSIGPVPASPYVSAAGEIRLRVLGTGTSENFNAAGDFMRFSIESPGSSPNLVSPSRSSSRVRARLPDDDW